MIHTQDIQIRDPYIFCDHANKSYVMYGTTDKDSWQGAGVGFDAYFSDDLENWDGPVPVFRPEKDFWGKENFWAPEVHAYRGKYYMLATFKGSGRHRGTAILVSDSLRGPFVEHSQGAVTPPDWDCLDGTLYVDEEGIPWMVFCHEWTQIHDGTICAAQLSDDLTQTISEPILLFKASDSQWSQSYQWEGMEGFITDGPSFVKHHDKLFMLWSSFYQNEYSIGVATSESGSVLGPWKHHPAPIYLGGGHCMVFKDFTGSNRLSFHQPNNTPEERPLFLELEPLLNGL